MIACFGGWWTVHRWPPKCPSVKRPRPRPIFRVPIQKMSQNLCSNWVKTDDWQFYAFEILGAIPACSKSLHLNCIKTHHNTSQTKHRVLTAVKLSIYQLVNQRGNQPEIVECGDCVGSPDPTGRVNLAQDWPATKVSTEDCKILSSKCRHFEQSWNWSTIFKLRSKHYLFVSNFTWFWLNWTVKAI